MKRLHLIGLLVASCFYLVWIQLKQASAASALVFLQPQEAADSSDQSQSANVKTSHLFPLPFGFKRKVHSRFPAPPKNARKKPTPLVLLEQYMQQHSHEALLKQPHGRQFIVARYSCPRQAGNYLHDWLDNLAFAVITNRTLLWNYKGQTQWKEKNSYENCHALLDRHEWIPEYDHWAPQLNLPPIRGLSKEMLERASSKSNETLDTRAYPVLQPLRMWKLTKRVEGWHGRLQLQDRKTAKLFQEMFGVSRERIQQLYVEGHDFLYGMLYRHTLTLKPQWKENLTHPVDPHVFSLGIHSRHPVLGNASDNELTKGEKQCLKRLLRFRRRGQECHFYIIADRPSTVDFFKDAARQYGCLPFSTNHSTPTAVIDKNLEHGPWAGVGFFRDLEFVADRTETAVLGSRRSSSALMVELVAYDRRMRAWERQQLRVEEMLRCNH